MSRSGHLRGLCVCVCVGGGGYLEPGKELRGGDRDAAVHLCFVVLELEHAGRPHLLATLPPTKARRVTMVEGSRGCRGM